MLKIPKSAAYLILAVLFSVAIYMVYTADGVGDLLPSVGWNAQDPSPEDPSQLEGEQEQPGDQEEPQDPDQEEPGGDETSGGLNPEDPEWDLENKGEFFVEYRLERERIRSKEQDLLQQMINNPNVSQDAKADAETKLLKLQENMELELTVENGIKAQGFKNAVLVVQEDGALVIVQAEELSSEDILLIAEIASKATGLRPSQINISNQVGK